MPNVKKRSVARYYYKRGSITVLAFDYIVSISLLYHEIVNNNNVKGNAHSLIVISAIMIESIVNRLKYDYNDIEKDNRKFFHKYCIDNNLTDIYDAFCELMLLRNIIAHNHIWFLKQNRSFKEIDSELLIGKNKDYYFTNYVNLITRKSKIYKLHIIPNKINLKDINIIINIIDLIMNSINKFEASKRRYHLDPNNKYFKYKGKTINWGNFIKIIGI